MTLAKSNPDTNCLTIEGITEPVILDYFETLNAGDFEGTAALFAPDGVMYPPFESAIAAADLADYLEAEAVGMTLYPQQGILKNLAEDRQIEVRVTGKVDTPYFSVNVAWSFVLNSEREILAVEIKLLASPQELLNLRR
ncbi:MAG: nuclear transport factor 2 family protein [Oscillatoria sp. PMC 1051.18]|nr:nuclear transport factor 2 family protein [Oscillatoria sp. PMC 1050.18]MEC5032853.1 nuclear transport factor 2 family protein [Oscillatoria sp. PMC 1051.18]